MIIILKIKCEKRLPDKNILPSWKCVDNLLTFAGVPFRGHRYQAFFCNRLLSFKTCISQISSLAPLTCIHTELNTILLSNTDKQTALFSVPCVFSSSSELCYITLLICTFKTVTYRWIIFTHLKHTTPNPHFVFHFGFRRGRGRGRRRRR